MQRPWVQHCGQHRLLSPLTAAVSIGAAHHFVHFDLRGWVEDGETEDGYARLIGAACIQRPNRSRA